MVGTLTLPDRTSAEAATAAADQVRGVSHILVSPKRALRTLRTDPLARVRKCAEGIGGGAAGHLPITAH